jgi:hypothetical protein
MEVEKILDLVAKYGPVAAEYFGGRKATSDLQEVMGEDTVAQQYDDLEAELPKYEVGPAWNKYLSMAMENPAADAARKDLEERRSDSVRALTTAGSKAALGGLNKIEREMERTRGRIDAREFADLQKAMGLYAAQQQKADMMNTMAEQRLRQSEMSAQRQAQLYNQLLEGQRSKATGQAIGTGLELLGDLNFGGGEGGGLSDFFNRLQLNKYLKGMQETNPDQVEGAFVGPTIPDDLPEGKRGMITPGAFSHESNPIDVVQDGAKIAELTGGETVLNPDQANQVAKESSFFRKLQRQFKKAQKSKA